MFLKILALLTMTTWLFNSTATTVNSTREHSSALAQQALVTACVGPMTLQIAPKDQGPVLIAFGADGCSSGEAPKKLFGLRLGTIAPVGTEQKLYQPRTRTSRI